MSKGIINDIKKYRWRSPIWFFTKGWIGKKLPDALFLKIRYNLIFNESLDLNNPLTFNQKLQWLKLYDRKPEYTTMVDKYAVKKYIAEKIGSEYIIPTLGV